MSYSKKVPNTTHCGLCQVKVTNFKVHLAGPMHQDNLKKAAEGEFGLIVGGVANNQLIKESQKRMDDVFRKLREGIENNE